MSDNVRQDFSSISAHRFAHVVFRGEILQLDWRGEEQYANLIFSAGPDSEQSGQDDSQISSRGRRLPEARLTGTLNTV